MKNKLEAAVPAPPAQPVSPAPTEKPSKALPPGFPLKVPSILLEGDEPALPPVSGVGLKYGVPMPALATQLQFEEGVLPDAYGTGRLFLVPRDPHCLYAHWDLTLEQQQRYNGLSAHQHLILRLYLSPRAAPPVSELHVHPDSRHWFIHVDRPGAPYLAELGYYQSNGQWHTITTSDPAATPLTGTAEAAPIQFATLPPRPAPISSRPPPTPVAQERAVPPVAGSDRKAPAAAGYDGRRTAELSAEPLSAAARARALPPPEAAEPRFASQIRPDAPLVLTPAPAPVLAWTPEQEKLLEQVIQQSLLRHEWIGSAEILELVQGWRAPAVSSLEAARLAKLAAPAEAVWSPGAERAEVSSPGIPEMAPEVNFWFKVNAELVVYGATEPDAQVTIGGRRIRLRPDGTFSYRFSLPDGQYQLPIAATASHGDTRRAELEFSRRTQYSGEVGAQAQDPALRVPAAENVA